MLMDILLKVIGFHWDNRIHARNIIARIIIFNFLTFDLNSSINAQMHPAVAQRFDAFEQAWLNEKDAILRDQAIDQLEPLFLAQLTGQTGKASEIIDRARRTLLKSSNSNDWIDSLQTNVEKLIIDPEYDSLKITINHAYTPVTAITKKASIDFAIYNHGILASKFSIKSLSIPYTGFVKISKLSGDIAINWRIHVDGKEVTILKYPCLQILSLPNLLKRTLILSQKRAIIEKLPRSIGRQTWLFYHDCLSSHLDGTSKKFDLQIDASIFDKLELSSPENITSGKWLIPTPNFNGVLVLPCQGIDKIVRVVLPTSFKAGSSAHPLLVALHGAGNSENQFAVGHAQQFVSRCSQNGWILACPRNGICEDLQKQLDSWLGVATGPMAILGHSQGAAQALAFAARKPQGVKAVVALGGSGQIGDGAEYKKISIFLGIGSRDIASNAVTKLATQLQELGVTSVEFNSYRGIEHLMIVQAAIDDIFDFLKKSLIHTTPS